MTKISTNNHHDILTGTFEPGPLSHYVPDFAYNPLNLSGELYIPIIDEEWVASHEPPVWPDNKKFAVCLTHDVDAVSMINPGKNFRSIIKHLKTFSEKPVGENIRWLLIHGIQGLKGVAHPHEIYCEFGKWMSIEQEVGAHSTFFFAPEHVLQPHPTDCMYIYDQKLEFRGDQISVRELMRTIDAGGWEIGLHPSWNAHADLGEMIAQKEQIEQVLGHPIHSVRQHFLKFDPEKTHGVQAQAGFLFDSTLGYNDNVGFRRGTSYPFECLSKLEGKTTRILQIPLIAQDGALLLSEKGLRLNPEEALKYIQQLMESVKRVGGVLTLSWHPHMMVIPGFWDLYKKSLELIAKEDPWFGTVADVGAWWQEHVNIDLPEFTSKYTGA